MFLPVYDVRVCGACIPAFIPVHFRVWTLLLPVHPTFIVCGECLPVFLPVYVRVRNACIPVFLPVHYSLCTLILPVHVHLQSMWGVFTSAFQSVNLIFTSACPPSGSLLFLCSGELTELCGQWTSTAISLETQGAGVSSHRVSSKQRVRGKSSLEKCYWATVWSKKDPCSKFWMAEKRSAMKHAYSIGLQYLRCYGHPYAVFDFPNSWSLQLKSVYLPNQI
jgi:hypothetical protein